MEGVPNNIMQQFSTCPLCNKKYKNAHMALIQLQDQRSGLHITCSYCDMSVIVVLTQSQMGLMSVGIMTDLNAQEAQQLLSEDSISTNTILNLYQELQKSHIDMIELLADQKKNLHTTLQSKK